MINFRIMNPVLFYVFICNVNLQKVISIGKSFEKRDIFVAKVGYSKPYKKPSVFIEAGKSYHNSNN